MKGTKTFDISCPLSIMVMPNNLTEKAIEKALEEYFCCKFEVKEITAILKTNRYISRDGKGVGIG